MNIVLSILSIAAPLTLVTMGGLISEYAGRMALFLDGIINLGAFLCFAFTVLTKNVVLGCVLSVAVCTLLVYVLEKTASSFKANMFLASLAMNIFFSALVSLLSSLFFHTRGVLYSDLFKFSQKDARIVTSIVCFGLSAVIIILMHFTKTGLTLRITGDSENFLKSSGVKTSRYKSLSWIIAASTASLCGCVLSVRLSSFVPGIASGRGWTALATVFLGRKNPVIVVLSVLVFAAAEYCSSYIQNIPLFQNVPSAILLSLPYLVALLLIVIMPSSGKDSSRS